MHSHVPKTWIIQFNYIDYTIKITVTIVPWYKIITGPNRHFLTYARKGTSKTTTIRKFNISAVYYYVFYKAITSWCISHMWGCWTRSGFARRWRWAFCFVARTCFLKFRSEIKYIVIDCRPWFSGYWFVGFVANVLWCCVSAKVGSDRVLSWDIVGFDDLYKYRIRNYYMKVFFNCVWVMFFFCCVFIDWKDIFVKNMLLKLRISDCDLLESIELWKKLNMNVSFSWKLEFLFVLKMCQLIYSKKYVLHMCNHFLMKLKYCEGVSNVFCF